MQHAVAIRHSAYAQSPTHWYTAQLAVPSSVRQVSPI